MIRAMIFLVALVSGVAAVWLYVAAPDRSAAEDPTAAPEHEEIQTRMVLTTARDITPQEKIEAADLSWTAWPDEYVQSYFIFEESTPEAVERATGMSPRLPLEAGEPIRWSVLQPPRPEAISASLPAGKRAISIRVSVENTAGGFVLPDDRVDVIHTVTPSGASQSVSRTIATNVRVIAMDQTIMGDVDGITVISRTATLELDRDQVEAVSAAELSGQLSLALRSAADEQEPPEAGTGPVRILRGGQPDN